MYVVSVCVRCVCVGYVYSVCVFGVYVCVVGVYAGSVWGSMCVVCVGYVCDVFVGYVCGVCMCWACMCVWWVYMWGVYVWRVCVLCVCGMGMLCVCVRWGVGGPDL